MMLLTNEEKKLAQLELVKGFVLDWLPDESLYSLLARNHFLRGAQRSTDTIRNFFGTDRGSSLHDDLNELDVFATRTGGALGTAEYVLTQHTLFRFYRLFMNRKEAKLVEQGRRYAKTMLSFPLALSIGNFTGLHPLKGCIACMQDDQQNIGMSYWRLEHQYPGFWVCLSHDLPLQCVPFPSTLQRGIHWLTPGMQSFAPVPEYLKDQDKFTKLKWLSELSVSLTSNCESGAEHVARMRTRIRSHAKEAGVLTPVGKLRSFHVAGTLDLTRSLVEFLDAFRSCPEFARMPGDINSGRRLLSRYLNCTSKIGPVEQLLLTAWAVTELGETIGTLMPLPYRPCM